MAKLRVKADLGEDFSMDHALALWLLDTIPLLDVQSGEYPLDLLTLVESILEDPDLLLRKQLEKEKSRLIAQWKAEGVEYDERMARLQEVEYPKPQREFVYGTFNAFAEKHPWVGNENIHPKSIAREMFEGFRTFSDYVKEYELQRSEGLLLRHLNATWRVLAQTVPESAKTEEVREMEEYLAAMLRQVDSSLLEEWERLKNPAFVAEESQELRPPGAEEAARDITRDPKAFLAMVRTRILSFLGSWNAEEYEEALELLALEPDESEQEWTAIRLRERRESYRDVNDRPRLDAEGRNLRHTHLEKSLDSWRVEQVIQDLLEHNDWSALFSVDLSASRERAEPVLRLLRLAPF